MALFCFDGTSEFKEGKHGGTNVLRMTALIDTPSHYFGGVGNDHDNNAVETPLGLAFGYGGLEILESAMRRFIDGVGDDPVTDIVAFSRGAAIAIEFMHKAAAYARENGIEHFGFRFVGLMDTVFTFGLPNDIDLHYHHKIPDNVPVKALYHAVAMNETRAWFAVHCQDAQDNVEIFEQKGFKGAHADIGGGYVQRELSNIVLNWLIEGAKKAEVPFNNQLPAPRPCAEEIRSLVPIEQEYFSIDPHRLPRRENQWYWPQAPRRIPLDIVEDAALRGIQVNDWQQRIVKDYRLRPHPRVFKRLVNMSPYINRNARVVDPAKEFKTYVKKRANGKLIKTAEHIPLTLEENINYHRPPPETTAHRPRRHRHRR